jgi:DNA-binding LytR/AlgR family response regulator
MGILIVENELLVAAGLQSLLSGFGFADSVIASNYTEAVAILESKPIHLALLDINLGGYKTGIDVAQYIGSRINIPYIFLTAYEDMPTITAALATSPHGYLQKPFSKATLYAAIQLAISNFKKTQDAEAEEEDSLIIRDAMFVKDKNGYVRVPVAEIHYIHSDGNYMELHTANRKHLIRIPQKTLLKQLPPGFVKVHKSYIVNSALVKTVANDSMLVGDASVPLLAAYREDLLTKLKAFS